MLDGVHMGVPGKFDWTIRDRAAMWAVATISLATWLWLLTADDVCWWWLQAKLQVERRETQKREDIEALKSRMESDKIWAGNEVEKLRIKKEHEIALSAMHLEQAVRRFDLDL